MMCKEKFKIQIMEKNICKTCMATASYRKCQDCRISKCILCICKYQAINNSTINNKKPVTKGDQEI